MRSDVVDLQNIVVEPKDGLKSVLLNLAVTRFSEAAFPPPPPLPNMPSPIDQHPLQNDITWEFNLTDTELASNHTVSELRAQNNIIPVLCDSFRNYGLF